MDRALAGVERTKYYCAAFKGRWLPDQFNLRKWMRGKPSIIITKMLEDSEAHLFDGIGISAVKEQEIKADRKGQRGQNTQHGSILKSHA